MSSHPGCFFDENLAARLVDALADLYPGSVHVSEVGLAASPDRAIWAYARDHGLVIVTKDENFHRLGNCSTDDVIRLLLQVRREAIEGFMAHEEAAFLALA